MSALPTTRGSVEELHVSTGPLVVDPFALEAAAGELTAGAGDLALLSAQLLALVTHPGTALDLILEPGPAAVAAQALAGLAVEALAGSAGLPALAAEALVLAGSLRLAALRYSLGEEAAAAVTDVLRRAAAEIVVTTAPLLVGSVAAVVALDAARHTAAATATVLDAALQQVRTGVGHTDGPGGLDLAALQQLARTEFGLVGVRVGEDAAAVGQVLAAHPEVTQEVVATLPVLLEATAARSVLLTGLLAATTAATTTATTATGSTTEGGYDVPAVAAALTAVGALGPVFSRTDVRVQPLTTPRAVPTRAPAGIADVLDGVAHQSTGWGVGGVRAGASGRLSPAGRPPPGMLRVERLRTATGATSWVVQIPGTQDWSPVPEIGGTPMDLTTNLDAMAGRPTATGAAVVAAMRAAGVAAGEPVLLAGHSQGGLTAAALAGDPEVLAEFTVTHVVTAGSPVDVVGTAPGVRVLSLEHTGDLVPALDGADAHGSADRVVVRRDVSADPAVVADPLAAHGWSSYLGTAALVDVADDPALVAFRTSASAFFDHPDAQVHVFDYQAVRTPLAPAGREGSR